MSVSRVSELHWLLFWRYYYEIDTRRREIYSGIRDIVDRMHSWRQPYSKRRQSEPNTPLKKCAAKKYCRLNASRIECTHEGRYTMRSISRRRDITDQMTIEELGLREEISWIECIHEGVLPNDVSRRRGIVNRMHPRREESRKEKIEQIKWPLKNWVLKRDIAKKTYRRSNDHWRIGPRRRDIVNRMRPCKAIAKWCIAKKRYRGQDASLSVKRDTSRRKKASLLMIQWEDYKYTWHMGLWLNSFARNLALWLFWPRKELLEN